MKLGDIELEITAPPDPWNDIAHITDSDMRQIKAKLRHRRCLDFIKYAAHVAYVWACCDRHTAAGECLETYIGRINLEMAGVLYIKLVTSPQRFQVRWGDNKRIVAIGNATGYQRIDDESLEEYGVSGKLRWQPDRYCRYCWGLMDDAMSHGPSGDPVCLRCAQARGLAYCEHCGKWEERVGSKQIYDAATGEVRTMKICYRCENYGEPNANGGVIFKCSIHNRLEIADTRAQWKRVDDRYACKSGVEAGVAAGTLNKCDFCGSYSASNMHRCNPHKTLGTSGTKILNACRRCFDKYDESKNIMAQAGLRSYGLKPLPVFYGDKKTIKGAPGILYMGVELEVDGGNSQNDTAMKITNRAEGRVYCKSDCSLNEGIEIVTHPATVKSHIEDMPWEDMLEMARVRGFWSTSRCGLHVHLCRSYFGAYGSVEREASEARLIYIYDTFYDKLRATTGRQSSDANHWAKRSGISFDVGDDQATNVDKLKKKKQGQRDTRYYAVNVTNETTFEIRLYRSVSDVEKLKNVIDMTSAIATLAKDSTLDHLSSLKWSGFCKELVARAYRPENLERFLTETGK